MTQDWTILKCNHLGKEVWRYPATKLSEADTEIQLEAFFNLDDRDAGYVVYKRGDRFVESFYRERWYNVFAIYDRDDKSFKGWYCNITRPATWDLANKTVAADDLALDVWVWPDGTVQVMDEDEFQALNLNKRDCQAARNAVDTIIQLAQLGDLPK